MAKFRLWVLAYADHSRLFLQPQQAFSILQITARPCRSAIIAARFMIFISKRDAN